MMLHQLTLFFFFLTIASLPSLGQDISSPTLGQELPVTDPYAATRNVLKQLSQSLHKIHTATYTITEREYGSPTDSFEISKKIYTIVECENPADTAGNAMKVVFDSSGKFSQAYDGDSMYYFRDGTVNKTFPNYNQGIVSVKPPFINHVTSLVDFLITSDNPRLTMESREDETHLTIESKINSRGTITFYGKPRVYYLPNSNSHFVLKVNRRTGLPDHLSYLSYYPRIRYEIDCSDLDINPFPTKDFSVADYLPEEEPEKSLSTAMVDHHLESLVGTRVPEFVLQGVHSDTLSLSHREGRPILLILTMVHCGACEASYEPINRLKKEYESRGLEVAGILLSYNPHPKGVEKFVERHNLDFPIYPDDGTVHKYFSLVGVSPVFCTIDKDGVIRGGTMGFSTFGQEKYEAKIRAIIEASLE